MAEKQTRWWSNLDRSNLQRFLVDSYVYLTPDASFGAAMLAGVPFAFTLSFDACAINQKVQRAGAATIRQVHVQRPLAAAQRAEIGNCPVQPDHLQQAFHKASGLSERQVKQHLDRQAGLDRSIAKAVSSAALAARWRNPDHIRVEPNRQRPSPSQRLIIR